MKLNQFLTPYTKINSKWIKNINVRPETMKLLLDMSPQTWTTKKKINKWEYIKLKVLVQQRKPPTKQKDNP